MTVPTNTVTQFSTVGDREDLANVIFDISPTETPFFTNCIKNSATSTLHEWQTDSLDAAAANQNVEGDDAEANSFSASTRLANYCQISRKVVVVSGTARSVDHAGRADELSYQVTKRGKELKRDIEFALTRNQGSTAGGISSARGLASVESWLATNKTSVGTGTAQTTPGYASGIVEAPTDSTVAGAFTKSALDDVIQKCWTEGGDPTMIMVGPFNRTVISGFTGISTLETRADQGMDITLVGGVDFYKSNFGTLKVVPNRFMRDQTALILDMDYWATSFLRPIQLVDLAKTGDSEKRMMVTEYTLESRNELASGKVTDLTTS